MPERPVLKDDQPAESVDATMSRRYPLRPWVGVGVIVWRGDRVLLVRRGRPPMLGAWSLPGGAQELGETIFEAAVREVAEETGLVITPTAVITAVDAVSRDEQGHIDYHYTIIEVSAESPDGDVVCGDDADDFRWVTLAELPEFTRQAELLQVVHMAAGQRGG